MIVTEIWRYPVKSAQGEPVRRSVVTGVGLEWDRQLAIVDIDSGRPLTGRRAPRLLMLSAAVVDGRVRVHSPEGQPLTSDDELSTWLERRVRLARPPADRQPEYEFPVNPEDEAGQWDVWSGPADVWHDSAQARVLILSTTSLRDWSPRRFRPNVVVDGSGEDQLVGRRIAIGSVVLDVMKRIDRCVMVSRAQPGGIERELGVLRTVMRECGGAMGVGAVVASPGEMGIGDDLRDLGPAPPPGATEGQ